MRKKYRFKIDVKQEGGGGVKEKVNWRLLAHQSIDESPLITVQNLVLWGIYHFRRQIEIYILPCWAISYGSTGTNKGFWVLKGVKMLIFYNNIYKTPYNFFFMHFCPGTVTTHAESINSDLQRGLDRRLRHIQQWTQKRTSSPLKYQRTTNTTATLVVKHW